MKPKSAISFAAQLMGSVKSKKKAEAARRNGKLGGAPKKKNATLSNKLRESRVRLIHL